MHGCLAGRQRERVWLLRHGVPEPLMGLISNQVLIKKLAGPLHGYRSVQSLVSLLLTADNLTA